MLFLCKLSGCRLNCFLYQWGVSFDLLCTNMHLFKRVCYFKGIMTCYSNTNFLHNIIILEYQDSAHHIHGSY